jgi:cysteine synthase
MLKEAHDAGGLEGVSELIENSSGGTALVLKIVGEVVFGISKLKAIVPSDMAPGKLETLRLLGVQYMFSSAIENGLSGPEEAARLGKEPGRHSPGQYMNDANVRANARWLASQIWEQTAGQITRFYAPLGTSEAGPTTSRSLA